MPERRVKTPISESTARSWKVGDILYLSGDAYSGLNWAIPFITKAHKAGEQLPFKLEGMIYSQGFTTSARYNAVTPEIVKTAKVRVVFGKGGMNNSCLEAFQENGCVYATGAAKPTAYYAQGIVETVSMNWPEELPKENRVNRQVLKNFGPLILTMDANGNSIYNENEKRIDENYESLLKRIGAWSKIPPYHLSAELTR